MRNRIIGGLVAAGVVAGAAFALANSLNAGGFDSANVNALAEGAADVCDLSVTDVGWNVVYDAADDRFNTTGADLEAATVDAPCGNNIDDVDEAHFVLLDSAGAELLDAPFYVTDTTPTDGLTFDWSTNTSDVTVQDVDRVVLIIFNDDGTAGN